MVRPDSSTYLKAMGIPVWKWRGGDSYQKRQSEQTAAIASATARLVMVFQGALGTGVWVTEYSQQDHQEAAVMDLWHAMARATKLPFTAQDWGVWGDHQPKAWVFFGESLIQEASEVSKGATVIVTHTLETLLKSP